MPCWRSSRGAARADSRWPSSRRTRRITSCARCRLDPGADYVSFVAAITDNAMAARDVRPESKTGMDAAAVIWRALALAVVAAAAVGIAALALSGVRWRESAGSLQWPA